VSDNGPRHHELNGEGEEPFPGRVWGRGGSNHLFLSVIVSLGGINRTGRKRENRRNAYNSMSRYGGRYLTWIWEK